MVYLTDRTGMNLPKMNDSAQPLVETLAKNAPNHGVETGQDQPQVE